jgi:hypothetical protein
MMTGRRQGAGTGRDALLKAAEDPEGGVARVLNRIAAPSQIIIDTGSALFRG